MRPLQTTRQRQVNGFGGCSFCPVGRAFTPAAKCCPTYVTRTGISRALKTPRRGVFAGRGAGRPARAVTSRGTRIRRRPLGRGLPSAAADPASAPCFRRRRRSPAQRFPYVYPNSALYKENRLLPYRAGGLGDPYGNRTHVTAVKGPCLNLLTNGPYRIQDFAKTASFQPATIATGPQVLAKPCILVAVTGFEPVTLRV